MKFQQLRSRLRMAVLYQHVSFSLFIQSRTEFYKFFSAPGFNPCLANESFTDCGKTDKCEASCDEPASTEGSCAFVNCVPKCSCAPGFTRLSMMDRSCVPISSCPGAIPRPGGPAPGGRPQRTKFCSLEKWFLSETNFLHIIEPVCGANEFFNQCGKTDKCEGSCDGPESIEGSCVIPNCIPKCSCLPGFVRAKLYIDFSCVAASSCPNATAPPRKFQFVERKTQVSTQRLWSFN